MKKLLVFVLLVLAAMPAVAGAAKDEKAGTKEG
jgi:hypothetical protein